MASPGVVHIVLFNLKSSLTDDEVKEVWSPRTYDPGIFAKRKQFCDDLLALKSLCAHPETQETYIVNSSGGKDHSPEGAQACFQDLLDGVC